MATLAKHPRPDDFVLDDLCYPTHYLASLHDEWSRREGTGAGADTGADATEEGRGDASSSEAATLTLGDDTSDDATARAPPGHGGDDTSTSRSSPTYSSSRGTST